MLETKIPFRVATSLFILFFIFVTLNVNAQNAYLDALKLEEYIIGNSFPLPSSSCDSTSFTNDCQDFVNYIEIIKPYLKSDLALKDPDAIINDLRRNGGSNYNPFLGPLLKNPSSISGGTYLSGTKTLDVISSLGGLNVTTIADGISQFLVERANEELNVMFFDNFKSKLEDEKEIQALFPTTSDILINSEPYQYGQLIGVLQASFRSDIEAIVLNLEDFAQEIIRQERSKLSPRQEAQLLLGARVARTIKEITQGTSLIDVFEGFPDTYLTEAQTRNNIYSTLKVASVFSKSIRSEEDGKIYVPFNDLKTEILEKEVPRKIFFGLLHEQLKSVQFYNTETDSISVTEILTQAENDINFISNYYAKLITITEEFTKATAKLEKEINAISDSIKYIRYYQLFDLGINLIDKGFNFDILLKPLTQDDTKSTIFTTFYEDKNRLIKVLKNGNEIYKSLNEKDYFSTFTHSISIYQTLTRCGSYTESKDGDGKKCYKIPVSEDLVRYGTFMVNLAEAESPKAVKAAIKSAALPTGSSTIKKHTTFSIFINSYLGASRHTESIKNGDNTKSLAVHAPIGPEIAFGISEDAFIKPVVGSLGLFFPVIDLGAITSFRTLDENESLDIPPITLDNIYVQGFYLVVGINKMPISFGLGYQRGPQLREIGKKEITVDTEVMNEQGETITTTELQTQAILSEVRGSLKWFISVDIPIFKLYAKPRR